MTYDEAIEFIYSACRFGSVLGLDSIGELLSRLGNPQKQLQYIHVAGTNGKGSTCAMLANILQKQGYRTGLYISPYVEEFGERMQVNGQKIPPDVVGELTGQLRAASESMCRDGLAHPTEFELVTALAFLYFVREKCDYVVLEVGLGGRFDATNIIDPPLLAIITLIDIDHTKQLGTTIPQIAFEKCGIIKAGCKGVVSYGAQHAEALAVIRREANGKGVPLTLPDQEGFFQKSSGTLDQDGIKSFDADGTRFTYRGEAYFLPLLGKHQVQNALTVLAATDALNQYGVKISLESVRAGMETVRFPGRMERIRDNLFIDGAHNLSGMEAFCDAARLVAGDRRIIAVAGMLADKDYTHCAALLRETCDYLIATAPEHPRALASEEFAKVSGADTCDPDAERAVETALRLAGQGALVCVCGSLYLIGGIRRRFRKVE